MTKLASLLNSILFVVDDFVLNQMKLTESSMMTTLWKDPPVNARLHVYIFNVTNHEGFLSGKESKLKVEEIGPYVYEAHNRKKILNYSDDQDSLTFQNRVDYTFDPEMSGSGFNDKSDVITVPNLVMMTGMLNSETQQFPDYLKKSVAWDIISKNAGHKTPFITLPVADFLWGYEDELACIDTNLKGSQDENDPFGGSGFEDDFADFGDSSDFENIGEDKTKVNFRRDDGKCMFAALAKRFNGTWTKPKTISTGLKNMSEKGNILKLDGSSIFDIWQKGSECDKVTDSKEPTSLPPMEHMDKFQILVDIMCRKLQMDFDSNVNYSKGITAKRFVMSPNNFVINHSQNQCFGQESLVSGLPDGIFSIAKCAQGSPMVVSSPHFLNADNW